MELLMTWPNLIIFITTIVVYLLTNRIFESLIAKHDNLTNHFLANFSRVCVILIGLFIFASQYEQFDKVLNTLLANSALIVAVLGFALQNTLKNILAGLMLISSEAFKIGDRIRIPEKSITGIIEELTLRHTTVKLVTNERAIIPNSLMNEAVVVNSDIRELTTSYPISIPVSNKANVELAKDIIIEEIFKMENILNKENTFVTISNLTIEEVELKSLIWTKDINSSFEVLSRLKLNIIKRFQENNIY